MQYRLIDVDRFKNTQADTEETRDWLSNDITSSKAINNFGMCLKYRKHFKLLDKVICFMILNQENYYSDRLLFLINISIIYN